MNRLSTSTRRSLLVALLVLLGTAPAWAQPRDPGAVLAGVRADLAQRGVSVAGPCGAFEIVSRAAWILRGEGYGLLGGKGPANNGCSINGDRYAIDILIGPDGCAHDVLVNAETENRTAWPGTVVGCGAATRPPFPRDLEPVVTPDPVAIPSAPAAGLDLSGVAAQLAALTLKVDELTFASGEAHAAIHQNITDARTENRSFFESVGRHWKSIAAIAGPAVSWWIAKRTGQP